MKQKIGFVLLLMLLLAACAPGGQSVVDVPSDPGSTATEAPAALLIDTPIPTATAAPLSATPVAPTPAAAATGCPTADAAKLGLSITEGFAFTTADEVLAWFCNGAEFEDILVALQTEELTGVPAEDMLAMLAGGMTWEAIWKSIGLTE